MRGNPFEVLSLSLYHENIVIICKITSKWYEKKMFENNILYSTLIEY